MLRRLWLIAAALPLAASGYCQSEERDLPLYKMGPQTRWLWPYARPLIQSGVLFPSPVLCHPYGLNRYELCTMAYCALQIARFDAGIAPKAMPKADWDLLRTDSDVRAGFWSRHLGDVELLLSETRRELESQGAPWKDVESQISGVRRAFEARGIKPDPMPQPRLFPDVPKDHWAALEVIELRKLGILCGYPDGRFRG